MIFGVNFCWGDKRSCYSRFFGDKGKLRRLVSSGSTRPCESYFRMSCPYPQSRNSCAVKSGSWVAISSVNLVATSLWKAKLLIFSVGEALSRAMVILPLAMAAELTNDPESLASSLYLQITKFQVPSSSQASMASVICHTHVPHGCLIFPN
jgi:hypothetical protein